MKRTILSCLFLLFTITVSTAAVIHVPGDYPTIQAAIDAAAPGDTVLVHPGIYMENLDFKGKAVSVKSADGPYVTIVDGHQAGPVVSFLKGEGPGAVLDGFSLVNGAAQNGAGILCTGTAAPVITRCAIHENTAAYMGGGIHCQNAAAPSIVENEIYENLAVAGGGISCTGTAAPVVERNGIYRNVPEHQGGGINVGGTAAPVIRENEIFENKAGWGGGGVNIGDAAVVEITGNLFRANNGADGGGVSVSVDASALLRNNLFVENVSNWNGGGVFAGGGTVELHNNTFFQNFTYNLGEGGALYATADALVTMTDAICWNDASGGGTAPEISGAPAVTYSDVEGGFPGTGNLDADPLFFNASAGDFHLKQSPCQPGVTNPCVDAGSDLAANVGMDTLSTRTDGVPDEGVVDLGYHYGPDFVPWWKRLRCDTGEISESTGGQAVFLLSAGEVNKNRTYVLLGGISGTAPGTPLPGGAAVLPLNWDLYTNLVMKLLNTGVFYDFLGTLDGQGRGAAVFFMPPAPGAAGMEMVYAYALAFPWDFVSNAVAIKVVP